MNRFLQRFAFEHNTTEEQETEVTIFAKMDSPNGLKQASNVEEHIQLEAKLGNQFCRVRKTTAKGEEKYTFTFKVKDKSAEQVASAKEYNVDVDQDFFTGFSEVAESKQEKTRYHFLSKNVILNVEGDDNVKSIELPEIVYEVDVFKKPNGEISEWCKIDVELDPIILFLSQNYPDIKNVKINLKVSHLPFRPVDTMLSTTENSDERAKIDQLYKTDFKVRLNAGD